METAFLWSLLCYTVEAGASVLMALALTTLAIVELKRGVHVKRKRRVKGTGRPGTW